MNNLDIRTSLRDLTFIFFKRKWSIVVIFMVTVLAASFWVMFVREDLYEVTAKILVKIGHEQAVPPTVLGDRAITIIGQRYQDVNSEADILTSADLLGRLVDELNLDEPTPQVVPAGLVARIRYHVKSFVRAVREFKEEVLIRLGFRVRLTPREKAIAMLQKGLLVTPQKDSNVLVVRLFLPSRQFGSVILNELVKRYQDFRLKIFVDQSVVRFFENEVASSLAKLEQAEQQLLAFESAGDIQAIDDQKSILLHQIAAARKEFTDADIAVQVGRAKVTRFEKDLESKEPDFASLGAFDQESFPGSLMLQLADLQKQLEALKMAPVANAELIQTNRKQFDLLVNMVASNLRSTLTEAEKTAEERKATLAAHEERLKALHHREMQWRSLKRQSQVLEGTYLFYQKKLEEASATAAMEQKKVGNVETIEHAIDPLKPAGIRKLMVLAMAVAFGLVAGLGWVAVLEFFDHRIYEARAVESRLGAPVMAVLPLVRSRRRSVRMREGLVTAGSGRRT